MTIAKLLELHDTAGCRVAFNTDNIIQIEEAKSSVGVYIHCTDGKCYNVEESYEKVVTDYMYAAK